MLYQTYGKINVCIIINNNNAIIIIVIIIIIHVIYVIYERKTND